MRSIASAMAWARGTRVSTSRYSSGVCALPPTGPDAAQRRTADAGREARIRAPAGELALDAQAGVGGGRLIGVEQLVRLRRRRHRQELAVDLELGRGAGHGGAVDDLLQCGECSVRRCSGLT